MMNKIQTSNFKIQNKSKIRNPRIWILNMGFGICFEVWILMLGFCITACSSNKPAWEYMPDMANQPSVKSQEYEADLPHHRGMRVPPEGTMPRGYELYHYKEDPEGAGVALQNPLPRTKEVVLAGEKIFNAHCGVCHGAKGLGDGLVVPPFPKPPSLQSEKVRNWSDGRIFHVITMGQNIMPSYASQITPQARWAAIHYIRILQLAQNPTAQDVEAYKKTRVKK